MIHELRTPEYKHLEKSLEGAGQLECSKREETVLLTAVSSVPRTVFGILQGLRRHLLHEKSTRVLGGMKQPRYKECMRGCGKHVDMARAEMPS